MRIHTNTLTHADLAHAAMKAGVQFADVSRHGSRSKDHAFNVLLTGNSKRRPNSGNRGAGYDDYAATWDQWGIFLAELYRRDSDLTCPYYASESDFHQKTGTRFVDLELSESHGDHTFRYNGIPRQQSCTKCDAVQRWS